ncbi:AAA family ATPase [Motiliproteus coralliicola]|uniref:AAA family ATPase n=1 Tax=Motiliproteus coralliicola TaxID=2283196 RepID=A0A369WA21_9GAMM|nr:AAA family ATPase [Motiliproteus coralliicola]RDE18860.1 AAA family ATPase [Motiliproteus coralliicola]
MYQQFFGLNELPFTLTPNTHYFLNLPTHQEALNLILVALENGDGFVKIVGEVGTGKTLLCRKVLNALDEDCISAYIPNPYLSADGFRMAFARELGLELDTLKGSFDLLERINQRLVELVAEGKRVVLIVDEAQAMPEKTIEALRLLTNLETETTKLFQVVLFGQPELDELLGQSSLRQLLQRITFSYRLRHLDLEGTGQYLHHRLTLAGYNGVPLFEAKAVKKLWQASSGTPRLINILAHKALMVAYGKGDRRVSAAQVVTAVEDTEGVVLQSSAKPRLWLAGLAMLAVGLSAGLVLGGLL